MQETPLLTESTKNSGTTVQSSEIEKMMSVASGSDISCIALKIDPVTKQMKDIYLGKDPEKASRVFELSWEEKFRRMKKQSWLRVHQFTFICNSLIREFKNKV